MVMTERRLLIDYYFSVISSCDMCVRSYSTQNVSPLVRDDSLEEVRSKPGYGLVPGSSQVPDGHSAVFRDRVGWAIMGGWKLAEMPGPLLDFVQFV